MSDNGLAVNIRDLGFWHVSGWVGREYPGPIPTSRGYNSMSGDGLTVGSAAKNPVGRLNRHFPPGCLRSCHPWGLQIKSPGPMPRAGLTVGSAVPQIRMVDLIDTSGRGV